MRCCFFSILCLLFSQHIYAEQVFRLPEQCLLGSWQSDKEKRWNIICLFGSGRRNITK